ncbi:MAG TPA: MMPL family transporter, partial [Patescibacteria group bacterium]|nr:MMPL family transporter [Patescibacteria group bacterium]
FYRFPGLLAVCALVLYSLIVFAIFKVSSLTSFPITITLAGLAGFVLSIGMAVDANILIFERMKEELRQGKPLYRAMDDGFSRAWLSIRDSNVSSLITCAILYMFGTSIVQGFALSLAIGIAVSMFSAITVTRTLMRIAMGKFIGKHLGLVASGMPKEIKS